MSQGGGDSKAKKKLSGGEIAAICIVVLLIVAVYTFAPGFAATVARAGSHAVEAIKSVFGREGAGSGALDASLM